MVHDDLGIVTGIGVCSQEVGLLCFARQPPVTACLPSVVPVDYRRKLGFVAGIFSKHALFTLPTLADNGNTIKDKPNWQTSILADFWLAGIVS
jgi:hypothetical protein